MLTFWTLPVLNGSNGLGATLSLCSAYELHTFFGDALLVHSRLSVGNLKVAICPPLPNPLCDPYWPYPSCMQRCELKGGQHL